jgi:alpha-1,6-mannosyltransferase
MVAAEARASGLPLIVPDEGGAGDQFTAGQGRIYAARSSASLARAVSDFIASTPEAHRRRAVITAPDVIDMDQHFDHLFATYAARIERLAKVA